jgi:hypothetical protein
MTAPIDVVEQVIIDQFAGRITRAEAIARIRSVINVTDLGAADLMDHPASARERYREVCDQAREQLRRLSGPDNELG